MGLAEQIERDLPAAIAEADAPALSLAEELQAFGTSNRIAHGHVVTLFSRDQSRRQAPFAWHVRRSADAVLVASGWTRDPDAAWSAAQQAAQAESQGEVVNCEVED